MNEPHNPQENIPTPEEYGQFINGIQLEDVRLVELKVEAKEATINPAETHLRVKDSSRFDNLSGGFEIFHTYHLTFEAASEDATKGEIRATFGLRFTSETQLTESYFKIFSHINLKMNTWPYWREIAQNMISRMGWPGFTMPLLKTLEESEPKETTEPKIVKEKTKKPRQSKK
jgi:hypothetical protein